MSSTVSREFQDLLESMNGQQIWSPFHDTLIEIQDQNIIKDGRVIDTIETDSKVELLWKEFCHQAGPDFNQLKQAKRQTRPGGRK